jgi:hypothetical protein
MMEDVTLYVGMMLQGVFSLFIVAWNSICPVQDKVDWRKLVWHKHVIP